MIIERGGRDEDLSCTTSGRAWGKGIWRIRSSKNSNRENHLDSRDEPLFLVPLATFNSRNGKNLSTLDATTS